MTSWVSQYGRTNQLYGRNAIAKQVGRRNVARLNNSSLTQVAKGPWGSNFFSGHGSNVRQFGANNRANHISHSNLSQTGRNNSVTNAFGSNISQRGVNNFASNINGSNLFQSGVHNTAVGVRNSNLVQSGVSNFAVVG